MQFRPRVTLDGETVRLVPLSVDHVASLVEAGHAPEIWTHLLAGDVREPERMHAFIDELLERQVAGTDLPFTVLDARTGTPIGMTRYLHIQRPDRVVEVGGTWYERSRWRTAVNTESKLLMLKHAFEDEGCHRVELRTDLRNERSQRAIERLGATREGILREHLVRPDGSFRSSVCFGILVNEWPAIRLRLEAALAAPSTVPLSTGRR
jgi:N-acetyltransferase